MIGGGLSCDVKVSQIGTAVATATTHATPDGANVGRATNGRIKSFTDAPRLFAIQSPDAKIASVAPGVDAPASIFDVPRDPTNTRIWRSIQGRV